MQIWTEPVFSKQRVIIFSTAAAPQGLRLHICSHTVVSLSTVGVMMMSQVPHSTHVVHLMPGTQPLFVLYAS